MTLAGATTTEFRATLLQFGSGRGCTATSDLWRGPICGRPAPHVVVCEDATAGVTVNGSFSPATIQTVLCADHLAQLRAEPRLIFEVDERADPLEPQGNVAIIPMPWSGGAS